MLLLNLAINVLGSATLENVVVQATENISFFFSFSCPQNENSCQINLPGTLIQFFI